MFIRKTKKYIFSSSRKKVIRISKNGEEITKSISYRLKIIDNARFMARSLSNLVNNLASNTDVMIKECGTSITKYKDFKFCLEYKYNNSKIN